MITAIEIENFKGIGERVRVPLKPITLLFGANSAGKSSIIQALHYAREIFERGNFNASRTVAGGDVVNLGGFRQFVHDRNTTLPVRIRFDLDLEAERLPPYGLPHDARNAAIERQIGGLTNAWVEVELRWNEVFREVHNEIYRVGLGVDQVADIQVHEAVKGQMKEQKIREKKFEKLAKHPDLSAVAELRLKWEHPMFSADGALHTLGEHVRRNIDSGLVLSQSGRLGTPLGFTKWGRKVSTLPKWGERLDLDPTQGADRDEHLTTDLALTRIVTGPGELVHRQLRRLRYLGPIRAIPSRNFEPPDYPDDTRWANGLAAWDYLYRRADNFFIEQVNRWLKELGVRYTLVARDFGELDLRRVTFKPEGSSVELSPADLGVGISQLVPAVVLALIDEEEQGEEDGNGQLIAIEQPELHLHPALQAELGDLFIESALGERKNTVILETHSEHLILRLLRRIRETTEDALPQGARPLRPEDVSVIYVEPGDKGVKVSVLRIDETGEFIDRWPKGFFEERVDELF